MTQDADALLREIVETNDRFEASSAEEAVGMWAGRLRYAMDRARTYLSRAQTRDTPPREVSAAELKYLHERDGLLAMIERKHPALVGHFRYAMDAAPAAVEPRDVQLVAGNWPLIHLGYGKVEVAEGHHEGIPALIFGRNGSGKIGEPTQPDRAHLPGETLAVVTFTNVDSLDVVARKLSIIRDKLAAAPAEAPPSRTPLLFDNDWLRKKLADEDCDPPSCPHGVMAGPCPACLSGARILTHDAVEDAVLNELTTMEQSNDDDGASANRGEQGVRSVSVERAGSEAGRPGDGQAGAVHDAVYPRGAERDREGDGRLPVTPAAPAEAPPAVERIVPSELSGDELMRRNGEYVAARHYDEAAARIESLQAELERLMGFRRKDCAAMDDLINGARKDADALAAKDARIGQYREALRVVAIAKRSGNALYPWSCQLCSWAAWSDGEPERHKPGCLATPNSAASPTDDAANRCEQLEAELAASRERERAERERADRLWQECENLRVSRQPVDKSGDSQGRAVDKASNSQDRMRRCFGCEGFYLPACGHTCAHTTIPPEVATPDSAPTQEKRE